MVDAIKTTVNRLELTKGRASEGRPANAGKPAVPASQMVDDVRVSDVASVNAQMQIAQTPPIDNEAVSRTALGCTTFGQLQSVNCGFNGVNHI